MLKPRHHCFCLATRLYLEINTGAPRGLWELGRRAIYFQGDGSSASEGKPPDPPLGKSKCIYFRALTCYSALVLVKGMANDFYYC